MKSMFDYSNEANKAIDGAIYEAYKAKNLNRADMIADYRTPEYLSASLGNRIRNDFDAQRNFDNYNFYNDNYDTIDDINENNLQKKDFDSKDNLYKAQNLYGMDLQTIPTKNDIYKNQLNYNQAKNDYDIHNAINNLANNIDLVTAQGLYSDAVNLGYKGNDAIDYVRNNLTSRELSNPNYLGFINNLQAKQNVSDVIANLRQGKINDANNIMSAGGSDYTFIRSADGSIHLTGANDKTWFNPEPVDINDSNTINNIYGNNDIGLAQSAHDRSQYKQKLDDYRNTHNIRSGGNGTEIEKSREQREAASKYLDLINKGHSKEEALNLIQSLYPNFNINQNLQAAVGGNGQYNKVPAINFGIMGKK